MNLREAAERARRQLEQAGVPEAQFEAEHLARHASGLSRAQYFAGAEPSADAESRLAEATVRRVAREPAPYITGTREFYGRSFAVGPGVLVPRPETELLVDLALAELDDDPWLRVVDIGTGSGVIAVSIGAERPGVFVAGIDISSHALAYARENARRHAPHVRLIRGDLAVPIGRADIVLANLPYIPADDIDALEPEVSKWEPRVALDGGPDGLAIIRRLVADCGQRLRPRVLALEVGYGQAADVALLLEAAGASTSTIQDLAGIDRVVVGRWPSVAGLRGEERLP